MTTTYFPLTDTGVGNANPTLSFNLSPARDFNVGMQYIDLMNSMRPWLGHRDGSWGGVEIDDLKDGGYLDEDGWPTEIPEGVAKIGTVFGWDEDSAIAQEQMGRYVIKYEGEGELEITGDVNIISRTDGEIVFDNAKGDKWFLNIVETDPDDNGNYIRNISVVAEEHVELHEAGALFNPAWLALIEDSRELRFMDWMGTNGSEVTSWDDMPSPDGPKIGSMVPIEHMVQLANETGTDPWFTIPHLADEDFIRQFAEYVHENLDPALTVRVEYSNEMWNWNFPQTHWAKEQSFEAWGENAHRDYYVKKSVETALIWQDVFGEDTEGRLVNVLATQTSNSWIGGKLFDPAVWRENEPDNYVDPATVFDELAVTTYFGNSIVKTEQLTGLLEAIKDPDVDANAYLYDQMMDPEVSRSIPEIANFLAQNAAVAQENGVKLVSYEGGQHLHHQIRSKDVSKEDLLLIGEFMGDFVDSEEMAALYAELWDVWANVSDGAFMQFTDTGTSSKFGSWGLYEGPNDKTPRAEILEELNATSTPWWDDDGGDHYLQGKIVEGTDASETLIGTAQEDYLLGSDGDDILVGGAKNDGLHGGEGNDRAIFSGLAEDYIIITEGDGYRVTGPDGSDLLIQVEEVSFDDDVVFVLDDQARAADGTVLLGDGTTPPVVIEEPAEDPVQDKESEKEDTDEVRGAQNPEDVIRGVEADTIVGTAAHNSIFASANADTISGGQGNDVIYGYAGDDNLAGNSGHDSMYGGEGNDVLLGGGGSDIIHGGDDDDRVNGNSGDDTLYGNAGNDVVIGAQGHDTIYGNGGNDRLDGHTGDDILFGGTGIDDIFGGDGNDTLNGGAGDDSMRGGEGHDLFLFALGDGTDIIHDFCTEDELVLTNYFEGCDLAIEDRMAMNDGHIVITNGMDMVTLSKAGDEETYQYLYDMIF